MLAPELIRIQEKPLANWVTRAKVNAIRGEFMRQCDELDGLADGVINNYMACRAIFDVTQGAAESAAVGREAMPGQRRSQSGGHQRRGLPDRRQISTLEFVYSRYPFATPLAQRRQDVWHVGAEHGSVRQRSDRRHAVQRTGRRRGGRAACTRTSASSASPAS